MDEENGTMTPDDPSMENDNKIQDTSDDQQKPLSPWDKYLKQEAVNDIGPELSSQLKNEEPETSATEGIEPEASTEEKKQSVWDRFLLDPSKDTDTSGPKQNSLKILDSGNESNFSQPGQLANYALAEDVAATIFSKLDDIQNQIDGLRKEFNGKIRNDAQKDKMIDNLHKELQGYKDDLVKKHLKSMVMDMIKIIDNIRKLSNHYSSLAISEVDPKKLVDLLENIPSDLEDLFYWQDVKSFTCDGGSFDPTRQRVLKTVETPDKEKDKTVAESMRPGYEWEGQVIRPEMVAVYVYKAISENIESRSSDE